MEWFLMMAAWLCRYVLISENFKSNHTDWIDYSGLFRYQHRSNGLQAGGSFVSANRCTVKSLSRPIGDGMVIKSNAKTPKVDLQLATLYLESSLVYVSYGLKFNFQELLPSISQQKGNFAL